MKRSEEEMKQIGLRIKNRRLAIGLSATQLADRVGLHKATIHRYEAGEMKEIKTAVLDSIAENLYVSREWLLGETREMRPKTKKTDVLAMAEQFKRELNGNNIITFGDTPANREAVDTLLAGLNVIVSTAKEENARLQREQVLRKQLMNQKRQAVVQ